MERIEVSNAMRIALLGLVNLQPEYDRLLSDCIRAVRTHHGLEGKTIVINPDHTHWLVTDGAK